MSIKGLTDRKEARFPRIGFLRKGGPKRTNSNGKEIMGVDLDHFRFDSEDVDACAAFVEAYGNEPKQINVFFPWPTVGENFQAWKEAYTAGALQHRCDGETCVLWLGTDGEYSTAPKPCPGGCKEVGYLSVIIPELGRFAFVTALTHSINDIMELQSNLEAYELLGGQLRGVPFVLRRIERKISTPGQNGGKRVRRAKWLMHLETKPEWTRLKLAGMEMDAIPVNVRISLPAPVEAQYIIENFQAEQTAASVDAMTYQEQQDLLQANVNRMRGPQHNAFDDADGEYRIEELHGETHILADTAQDTYQPEPGEEIWADWRNPTDAHAWAMTQGKFNGRRHMENAYAKVKGDCAPKTAREMWRCWYEYVMAHEPAKAKAADGAGDWAEIDAHGHDMPDAGSDEQPLFS